MVPPMIRLLTTISLVTFITACGGGGGSDTPTQGPPVQDTTPPVVTLNGEATINHEQGTNFTDLGASATDDTDGNVNVTTTGEVGSAAGIYTLTYTASDAAGNSATATRQVTVADTTAPVITLLGENPIVVERDATFADPGATGTDSVDGTVNVTVAGAVDTTAADDYTLTYLATDAAGNNSSVTRTVTVEDLDAVEKIIVLNKGLAGAEWDGGFNAFDTQAVSDCANDGGAGCPSIGWSVVNDSERGDVLEIEHSAAGDFALFYIISSNTVDMTAYRDGALIFDLKTVVGDGLYTTKLDCDYPCTSGDQPLSAAVGTSWTEIVIPIASLEVAGLDITKVSTGIVIWARGYAGNVFRVDNARFETTYSGEPSIGNPGEPPAVDYNIMQFGKGTISDTINPASYRCVFDFGNWIYNAGIVLPGIAGCDTATNTPQGNPTPIFPNVVGEAAVEPLATHRWWGGVTYNGEMTNNDSTDVAYVTSEPITARISNTGLRMMGIPAGLRTVNDREFAYIIPAPVDEVFDGIAIANSVHSNMDAYTKKTSDGSITIEWQSTTGAPVMRGTLVHGSPYIFLDVLDGDLLIKTLRADGSGEKGIYFEGTDSLGVWTNVAGLMNYYLVTGDGATQFNNVSGNEITVLNATKSYTVTWMPTGSEPDNAMIALFEDHARNIIDTVNVNYQIDATTQAVEVTQEYVDAAGKPVTTIAGLQPLHWKYSSSALAETGYQVRSARGISKFINQSSFSYEVPFVGVLPTIPTFENELNITLLTQLVDDFLAVPSSQWIRNGGGVITDKADTYWSGKAYNRVAELIAITDSLGLTTQKQQLFDWLKAELENWFTAETNGALDTNKYFVYDDNWDTLLGMDESFASHQQLNDHHFHHGYFVRAAAEICRHEADWCSDTNWGPMVELLIRDYAGGRNDPMFPYSRHFDPANGFSWASGSVYTLRGNNNESTSEAANAYGAMILYGLITGNDAIRDRGHYMHASTSAAYWEYWNNIGGYNSDDPDDNNFPADYNRIATSILWGDGGVFATFFGGQPAWVLGIQGLPTNPLNLHIGIYSDYLVDYVAAGLADSSNGKPSGLPVGDWPDIWWNIWAMTDAAASLADYETVSSYTAEIGESKAHTYHWLQSFKVLGQPAMGGVGVNFITADHPTAVVFDNNGVKSYVVYNYGANNITVTYSDGIVVNALPEQFTVVTQQ